MRRKEKTSCKVLGRRERVAEMLKEGRESGNDGRKGEGRRGRSESEEFNGSSIRKETRNSDGGGEKREALEHVQEEE